MWARKLDPQDKGPAAFESKVTMKAKVLVIEDAVEELDQNSYIDGLAIHNCSLYTFRLEKNHFLGYFQQEATTLPTQSFVDGQG